MCPPPKVEALRTLAAETLESLGAEASWRSVKDELRRVVDVCCGMCCMSIAHWLDLPRSTFILAIDIMTSEEFWEGIPEEVRESGCITYIELDVLELSLDKLRELVREAWGCGLSGVAHLHWSHMCTTLSRASRGRGGHRKLDFSPRSLTAIQHDIRFHHFLKVIEEFVQFAPLACVSLENPLSDAFPAFKDLQALAKKPGWQFVLRADHCCMADATDAHAHQPNKPSSWLIYGVLKDVIWPICLRSCVFRISPCSHLHRWLICRRRSMHPSQSVITDTREKSRIPFGASRFIFMHHMRWMRSAEAQKLAEQSRLVPMRKIAKIVGRLISMGLAVAPSQLMCRDLQRALYSNDVLDWEAWVVANPGSLDELLWIVRRLAEWNSHGIPIWKKASVVDVTVTQDSSPVGMGFRLEAKNICLKEGHMPFSLREAGLAHVHRELLGLAFIVAVHYEELADRCIQIRVDAKSSIKYVRDRGGTSEVMTYLTKIIWGLFIKHRISLSAIVHISGVEMVRI